MARILIVDDDADIRSLTKAVLTSAQHEVALAESAYEAFELLHRSKYDLLISDANMPQMDGFELVRRLRSNTKFRGLLIALLTGRRERDDIARAAGLGVNDYIVKPLDPLVFIKKIEDLLAKSNQPDGPEILLNEGEGQCEFTLHLTGQVLALSEAGVLLQTPMALAEGEKITLHLDLFKSAMNLQPQLMKVVTAESPLPGTWITRLHFLGASDATVQKLRGWINQRLAKIQRRVG